MSATRRRRQLAAALVVASTGLVSAGATLPAVAETPATTLYVDDTASNCSDSGPGTEAQPYCDLQVGADAAKPGQTVSVGGDWYKEQLTVHHSGEPGRPIVIEGRVDRYGQRPGVGLPAGNGTSATSHGILLDHVHDVTVRAFSIPHTVGEGILVQDSSAITVDSQHVDAGLSLDGTAQPGVAAVRIAGASHGVVVSRNRVDSSLGLGIAVEAGVSGAVVTTNVVADVASAGILVTDAPGTVVTGNTVVTNGTTGISLAGGSDHAVVENNVVADYGRHHGSGPRAATLAVSAASVAGTKVGYDTFSPNPVGDTYQWGADTYQQPAEFSAATGQGTHDLREAPTYSLEGAPDRGASGGSVDSADASAPGELDTDVFGHPRVDDPSVADSGTGKGYYDRGAVELTAYHSLVLDATPLRGPSPLTVTATATQEVNWSVHTVYTFDFGDGSTPVVSTVAQVQHVYRTAGKYRLSVTAVTDNDPNTATTAELDVPLTVEEPGPLVPDLRISQTDPRNDRASLSYDFDLTHSTSPWGLSGVQVDFGDGSAVQPDRYGWISHTYQRPGDYTVTATVKDAGGRTATVRQALHVTYGGMGFGANSPQRLLDTRTHGNGTHRLGPGESVTVRVDANAAVLNVTAVNPSQSGYLSVYPTGTPRPATSNVNFVAGQTVPNLVTVPTGTDNQITIYNFSGTTDVVVDLMGNYYKGRGDRFSAVSPNRLLDTRTSTPLVANETRAVKVRGVGGVPADATAVVLNLTSTGSDKGGFLTASPGWSATVGTSNLNFTAGQTVANQVVVPIGLDGKVYIYNHTGRAHVVADVFGYYGSSGSSLFTPVVPTRLVDTRQSSALGQGGVLKVDTGVPAGATGAVLNVTDTASTAPGYLTVWADGASKPGTSNVNFPAGKTVPNHVTTPLGANGAFDVYNFMGRSQVVADLFGYFAK
ncbi:hypothetical protein CFP65_5054 [Kitasatospora sp. MMS16-BH015]|uniref:PKD domain-containing protein n=1 Tax=Kitasatospora sp. MMS16-BH015 TaxID=2018025 RepID=UPI000CA28757|nr:right-handed parallel beta-helix repeat-containing protein [Kitasatospora sp. MMS16-BH015]AUG79767.1 hypothetical protein CFP65_5054 [Kitasatospora sp. MMS16-BH015]